MYTGIVEKAGKYIAMLWLSFLLLLGNTPMDFIHLFADHDDTVHKHHSGLVIEKKHHHCAFLSLTLASFINDYHVPVISFPVAVIHIARYGSFTAGHVQRCIVRTSLRGPPFVSVC